MLRTTSLLRADEVLPANGAHPSCKIEDVGEIKLDFNHNEDAAEDPPQAYSDRNDSKVKTLGPNYQHLVAHGDADGTFSRHATQRWRQHSIDQPLDGHRTERNHPPPQVYANPYLAPHGEQSLFSTMHAAPTVPQTSRAFDYHRSLSTRATGWPLMASMHEYAEDPVAMGAVGSRRVMNSYDKPQMNANGHQLKGSSDC